MTTIVKVRPSGHACIVTIESFYKSPGGTFTQRTNQEVMLPAYINSERTLFPEEKEFTVTTTQSLTVVDLEPDDDRVLEALGYAPKHWPELKGKGSDMIFSLKRHHG